HVDEALGAAHASVSLNQTVGAEDEGELGDLFADRDAADPFEEAEESLRRQGVRRALDALPERERRILELRFGFEGEPWPLAAIALLAASAAARPTASTTLVFGTASDPVVLDGPLVSDGESLRPIDQIFEGLVGLKQGTTTIVPALATKWKAAPGGHSWTFT